MKLPKELITVTPLSKVLASILFIALPFIGFSLGMQYQQTLNQAKQSQITTNAQINHPTPTPDPTANPDQIGASWKTYEGNDIGYNIQIKYPQDFKIDRLQGEVVLYKGEKLQLPPNSPIDPYPIEMAILARGNTCGDCQVFKLENLTIGSYKAVKAITNNKLTDSVWVYSADGKNVVRINYGANNESDKKLNDQTFNQILSTFTFLNIFPTPTCRPRPACLDAIPRCLIPETPDMCRPSATPPPGGGGIVCTQDAKLCPDGKTYVGHQGPKCEFAACPGQ